VKIYVAAMVALMEKEKGGSKQNESQFTTKKNGAFLSPPRPLNANTLFLNLMLRVLVLYFHGFRETSVVFDETLPTINKSKHPQKAGGLHGTKRKDPCPRRTTKTGQTTREHRIPASPLIARSISNNKRVGPLERMPCLEEPSSIAIA
jgi:hypothetical protein